MLVLTIRTDKPDAEIGLLDNNNQLAYETWTADRQLSVTIHKKIKALLEAQNKTWQDIGGIVCYKGPGSFTGLRIGLSVGNALSYGLEVPALSEQGKNWAKTGVKRLLNGENGPTMVPEYGRDVRITAPRK